MALRVDLPYFEMKDTSRAEAFVKFMEWYLKCEKDKDGKEISDNLRIQKFLTRLDLDAWTRVKEEISVYSIEKNKREENLVFDDYVGVFKKIFMTEKNSYIELVTMLKSINEKVADVDKLYEEITSVLRKTKMSSITMEELGGLLMILKFAAPEAMEPLLLKKAAEERLNNKSERRLAYAKEILDIIKELNTFSLALSSSKDSVHRVYTKSNDKFKKNTFKRKTFNKKIQCHRCNKYGHIARNCNEVIRKIEDNTSDIENESDDDEVVSVVGRIEGEKQLILPVKAYIGKKNCFVIKAEADSGSPRTFIARNQIPGKVELRKCSKRYVGVGGGEMATCGKIKMILEVNGKRVETDAIVTTLNYSLIGRTELIKLGLLDGLKDVCIKRIKSGINNDGNLEKIRVNLEMEIKRKCPNLIDGKLGCYVGKPIKLPFKEDSKFVIVPNRQYNCLEIEPVIEEKLANYEKEGLIKREKYPDAASPIMPMIKKLDQPVDKNNIRIVADYSLLNRNFKLNCYKMKSVDDVLRKVGNMMNSKKVYISTFDVQDCYGCIRIDQSDQSKVCINTHVGIFRLCRLPQGVSVSPPICQEIMDKIDKQVIEFCRKNYNNFNNGNDFIETYYDDTIIITELLEDHKRAVMCYCKTMEEKGFKLSTSKWKVLTKSTMFLGVKLCEGKFKPDERKIACLKAMTIPKDKDQLISFLGLVNYHCKYVDSLAQLRQPLDVKRRKDGKFEEFSDIEKKSFDDCIEAISNCNGLYPYRKGMKLIVESDASDTAMGAVLKAESGEIIEYYSKSFTATECRYPIQHKEALSCVLAIEHFKYYLMLKEFQLHTDHESLAICFNLEKGIKKSMSNRLQRFALRLMPFHFKVYYVSNKRVLCADTLSRLICEKRKDYLEEFLVCKIHSKNELYLRESQILKEAEFDQNYLLIRDKLINNESITHLGERFLDATVEDGLVKLGNQYLIPKSLHQRCLEILHTSHQSSSTMKRLARQFWYWSSMTKDIQEVYDKCEICNDNKIMPNKSLPFMENSLYPMERVHIDIGECFSIYFLVLHDSFSGYLDIFSLKNMSTTECLSCLNRAFSYLGYPTSIFSDQGRQFISQETKAFTLKHGITWYFSGAGHQSSNGAAERSIQTVKRLMKKLHKPGCDIDELFIKIKVNVNNVPSGKRQDSPNNLLFKYNCHSLVRTNEYLEGIPKFKIGSLVKFRLSKDKKWENGRIIKIHGSKLYDIEDSKNHIRFMHQDNIIESSANLNHLYYEDTINEQNKKETDPISTKERDYGKRKARKRSSPPLEHPMITRTKKRKGMIESS